MDIQQAINIALYKCFDKEGIEFAYPTQTLYFPHQNKNRLAQVNDRTISDTT
jgi:small-conductance mechanosensitive channel